MKRKHGSSGGGRGGGRGGRGRGGGRGGGRGDRSKRSRSASDYGPQPGVKPAQVTESNVSSEEEEEEYEEPTTHYTALLQTLQATNETFAKAYAPRRREEQGGGDSSEDDDDEAASELEDEAGLELKSELDGEAAVEDVEDADGEEDEDDEGNEDAEEDSGSESEWEEVVDGEDVDTGEAEEEKTDGDSDSERLPSEADAGIFEDPFKKHLDLELSDAKLTELVEGKAKFKTEVPAAGLPTGRWLSNVSTFPKVEKGLGNCSVKDRLLKHWKGKPEHKQFGDFHSEGQAQFFAFCNSYEDILLTQRCGLHGTVASNEVHQVYVDAYVLHILNHVLKTRDLVTKNNEKLQRQQSAISENGRKGTDFIDPPRDQGFTRPKVLIMLPLRSTALKFVKKLIELAPKSQTVDVEHKARFFDDFGAEDEDDVEEVNHDGNEGEKEDGNGYKGGKPADFKALFGGNNDDHFRIGIKFTRKSIKLYSDFYSSDIIVASPLGLITQIGEAETAKNDNNKDVDFLSSIEIVVMDYTDVIWMQNWQHLLTLFDHLNRIPQSQHGTDFMRIREWCLNGHSKHFRQTLILSTFPDAKINAFFHRSCVNHSGKVKLKTEYPGVLSKVMLKIRQVYERIDCKSITEVYDSRFDHFTKQVFPRIKDSHQGGILLFANSLDVRRIGNFLKAQNTSFCELSEYTKQSDISRARSWFYHKKRHIMLYTERAHFYHRYKIRGITELIFYSLPDHAQFYTEIANLLGGFSSCTVLFSKFDNFQLERVVGSSYARRMLESKQGTFTFM